MTLALETDLSIDECTARIASVVGQSESLFPAIAHKNISKEFRGSIEDHRFSFEKQGLLARLPARIFSGSLVVQDHGTTIRGRFEWHPFARLSFFLGFGLLGAIAVVFAISALADALSESRHSVDAFETLWSILLLPLLWGGTWWWAAKSEETDTLNFIEDLLEAKRIDD